MTCSGSQITGKWLATKYLNQYCAANSRIEETLTHESESARASFVKGFYCKDLRPRTFLFYSSENAHAWGKCQLSSI